jgi:hypothetical protein
MQVEVRITGNPPIFTVAIVPGPPYTAPLSIIVNNESRSACKLWYQEVGMSPLQQAIIQTGGTDTITSDPGISFSVTATGANVQPALSHVIHVGSGK